MWWPFRKKSRLQIGQVRLIKSRPAHLPTGVDPIPVGSKVIVKGAGEYDGWDVEVLLENGKSYDVGASWLLENSEVA